MGPGTLDADNRTGVMKDDGIIGRMRSENLRAARRRRALALSMLVALAASVYAGLAPASGDPLFLSSSEQGSWLAADKELHFAGSLAIAASLRVEGQRRKTAVAAAFGVGILKEVYDVTLKPRRMKRGASWKDLAADLAGAIAGIAIVSALD